MIGSFSWVVNESTSQQDPFQKNQKIRSCLSRFDSSNEARILPFGCSASRYLEASMMKLA